MTILFLISIRTEYPTIPIVMNSVLETVKRVEMANEGILTLIAKTIAVHSDRKSSKITLNLNFLYIELRLFVAGSNSCIWL